MALSVGRIRGGPTNTSTPDQLTGQKMDQQPATQQGTQGHAENRMVPVTTYP